MIIFLETWFIYKVFHILDTLQQNRWCKGKQRQARLKCGNGLKTDAELILGYCYFERSALALVSMGYATVLALSYLAEFMGCNALAGKRNSRTSDGCGKDDVSAFLRLRRVYFWVWLQKTQATSLGFQALNWWGSR